MRAGDPAGVPEARLVVLVRDLQALKLVLERVLSQPVMVEPQVHRLGLRGVEPGGQRAGAAGSAADIQLPRVRLPEILDAHAEPAAGIAEGTEAAGAGAARDAHPAVARGGPFAQLEAV